MAEEITDPIEPQPESTEGTEPEVEAEDEAPETLDLNEATDLSDEADAEEEPTEDAPAEEPAEPEEEATPAEEPATEESKPAAAPAASPEQQEAYQKAVQAFQQWESDFDALAQKVEKGTYDEIEDGKTSAKVMVQGLKYVRNALTRIDSERQEMQQERQASKFWDQWARDNADLGVRGRQIFEEEHSKLAREYPKASPESLGIAAESAWKRRIQLERAKAKAGKTKAPATKPAATAGGGRITPPGGQVRQLSGRPLTAAEKLNVRTPISSWKI